MQMRIVAWTGILFLSMQIWSSDQSAVQLSIEGAPSYRVKHNQASSEINPALITHLHIMVKASKENESVVGSFQSPKSLKRRATLMQNKRASIEEELAVYDQLKSIKISFDAKADQEVADRIGRWLMICKKVEEVDLSGTVFTDNRVANLTSFLQNACSLKLLNLSDTALNDEHVSALATALTITPNQELEQLYLHKNTLSDKGILALRGMFEYGNFRQLRAFNVAYANNPGILDFLAYLPELTSLDASGNKLNDVLSASFQKVKTHSALTELHLGDNQLTESNGEQLSQLIECFPALKELNLSGNLLQKKGLEPLLNSLFSSNNLLTHLDISSTQLQDEGASLVSEMLKTNTTLISLDMRNTGITASGAAELARAFPFNRTLQQLDLSNNKLTHGMEDLSGGLRLNYTLHTLFMKKTEPDKEDQTFIEKAREEHMLLNLPPFVRASDMVFELLID
jgi:Ran GTPase-activating protein (RanGAP) involved in mRNA processing and transport